MTTIPIVLFIVVSVATNPLLTCLGVDPVDSNRILIRKIVEVGDGKWAYDETRVTRVEGGVVPKVHTTLTTMDTFDLKEYISPEERSIRMRFRAMPNLLAFSLYYRKTEQGANHFSIVENTMWKEAGSSWSQWWADTNSRRDMSRYLRKRWLMN